MNSAELVSMSTEWLSYLQPVVANALNELYSCEFVQAEKYDETWPQNVSVKNCFEEANKMVSHINMLWNKIAASTGANSILSNDCFVIIFGFLDPIPQLSKHRSLQIKLDAFDEFQYKLPKQ